MFCDKEETALNVWQDHILSITHWTKIQLIGSRWKRAMICECVGEVAMAEFFIVKGERLTDIASVGFCSEMVIRSRPWLR